MSTYYYALKNDNTYIFDNFPKNLITLVASYKENQKVIEVKIDEKEVRARIGRKKNSYGEIFVLTTETRYINSFSLFKELISISTIALEPLSNFQNRLIARHILDNQEFIHNATSLNTYSIQDLFALVPQKFLNENVNKQNEAVKKIVAEKPNETTRTLIKLIKYNLAMKVEFSVFERTMQMHVISQKIEFEIRNIVLSVLQIFMHDFEEQKIVLSLGACERRINVDHDSLFVSLYYIFDNAIKYCRSNTELKIMFKEEQNCFSILFNMISVRIEDDEISKLTTRGYRSENIKQLNKGGNGIGMYRILKTLRFNDAELEVVPRINNYRKDVNGVIYEANLFKIKFIGQQDWFKAL